MKKVIDAFLSTLTAFVISAGGAILVVVGSGNALNDRVWILSAIVGAVTAAKDLRSYLRLPPVKNGSDTDQWKKTKTEIKQP